MDHHDAMEDDTDDRRSRPTRTQRTLARVADGDGVGNPSRRKALAQGCPTCGALAHKACISPKGDLRWAFHRERRPTRASMREASAESAGIESAGSRRERMRSIAKGPSSDIDRTPSLPVPGVER